MLCCRNCVIDKNYTVKISDHAMYCDRYENEYYVSDTKARLPIRWMSWEALLMVSPLQHSVGLKLTWPGLNNKLSMRTVLLINYFDSRASIRRKVMYGLLPLLCGRFWCCAPNSPMQSWPVNKLWKTAAIGTRTTVAGGREIFPICSVKQFNFLATLSLVSSVRSVIIDY